MNASAIQRVLFVCTGNTCRSVFAEYLARYYFGTTCTFESAGIYPQCAADAKAAIYTLKKNFNIDVLSHVPRDVRSLDLTAYSLIIALEAAAKKLVLELGASESKVKLWKIKDPYESDQGEYDKCGLDIKKRVVQLKSNYVRKLYVKGGT